MARTSSANVQAFVNANQGKHVCACGCGGFIVILPAHSYEGIPKYIFRHKRREPLAVRFWRQVDKSGACWQWTGTVGSHGYGVFNLRGNKTACAHRLSWEMHNGPVPDGLFILHDCPGGDNRLCVNPAHLRAGTHDENMADCVAKGGQPKGERRPNAKLTEAKVRGILQGHAAGTSMAELARRNGVTHSVIQDVIARRTWRHVTV